MGYLMVAHALRPEWAILTGDERVALIAMCYHCLDESSDPETPPHQYWRGRDYLMLKLDGIVHDPKSQAYATAAQKVRRILRRLENVGAIELLQPAGWKRSARYLLTCDRMTIGDESVDNLGENPDRATPQ